LKLKLCKSKPLWWLFSCAIILSITILDIRISWTPEIKRQRMEGSSCKSCFFAHKNLSLTLYYMWIHVHTNERWGNIFYARKYFRKHCIICVSSSVIIFTKILCKNILFVFLYKQASTRLFLSRECQCQAHTLVSEITFFSNLRMVVI
jgi:hypothetical protein